jgi:hypothetical protein
MKPEWASDRNIGIFTDVIAGHTKRGLAAKHKLSEARIGQIVNYVRMRVCAPLSDKAEEVERAKRLKYDTYRIHLLRINRKPVLERLAFLEKTWNAGAEKPSGKRKSQLERQLA